MAGIINYLIYWQGVIKMVKVFIPIVKGKYNKTLARGFWRNEAGRVYYDYVKIINYRQDNIGVYYQGLFYDYLDTIKAGYNQECIFYTVDNVGYCYYNRDKIEILPHRIIKEVLRGNLKNTIKANLKIYGGLTILNEAGRYYIEVFTTI